MRQLIPVTLIGCMLATAAARADVITTFDVTGNYTTPTPGTFSGTLTIDTTRGTVSAMDIDVPGVGTFTRSPAVYPTGSEVQVSAYDAADDGLALIFATATPGSLVGFDGGTLDGRQSLVALQGGGFLQGLSGSITTPAPAPTPTPEPSSLLLLAGALGFLGFGVNRARHDPR